MRMRIFEEPCSKQPLLEWARKNGVEKFYTQTIFDYHPDGWLYITDAESLKEDPFTDPHDDTSLVTVVLIKGDSYTRISRHNWDEVENLSWKEGWEAYSNRCYKNRFEN